MGVDWSEIVRLIKVPDILYKCTAFLHCIADIAEYDFKNFVESFVLWKSHNWLTICKCVEMNVLNKQNQLVKKLVI